MDSILAQDQELYTCIEAKNIEKVRGLIKNGADVCFQHTNKNNFTAVHCAAERGYTDLVEALLEENINACNIQDGDGRTPLHLSALNDHPDIVALLLKKGAKHYIQDKKGRSPIHLATHKVTNPINYCYAPYLFLFNTKPPH